MITGAILAADDQLSIAIVALAAVLGALAGDHIAFGLGHLGGRHGVRRLTSSQRFTRELDWARRQLDRRGGGMIVVARFLPGGRTATTFASGSLGMPWRRFVRADLFACALWGVYASALGYFGGSTFEGGLIKPLAVSLAVGVAIAAAGECYRRCVLDRERVG